MWCVAGPDGIEHAAAVERPFPLEHGRGAGR